MSTKLTYTGAEVQELLDKIEKGDFDNAKTLEGHPASYFAIASEFTSLAESFATEQGRINTLYSFFKNGSANDALRLGGQLPSYYATAIQYEILQQTLSDFKSLFDSMFEKDSDGNIHAKLSLWSSGGITAGGVGSGGSGGGGGVSYNRLDAWADYSADKSGWVLSALLGKDLDNRVSALANAGYVTQSALAPYALRSEIPSLAGYATESFVTSQGYITASALGGYASQSWVGENFLSKSGGKLVYSGAQGLEAERTDDAPTHIMFIGLVNGTSRQLGGFGMNGYNDPVYVNPNGIRHKVLTAENYADYALSKNGGTISDLIVDRNPSVIQYKKNGASVGYLGIASELKPVVYNAEGNTAYMILHSGNYSDYALPITGGTLNGNLDFNANSTNSTTIRYLRMWYSSGGSVYRGMMRVNDTNLALSHYSPTSGVQYELQIGKDGLNFNDVGVVKKLLHSGNYSDYALSTNGGTVNGETVLQHSNSLILTIKRTGSGASLIRYNGDEGLRGGIGFGTDGVARIWDNTLSGNYPILTSDNFSQYALPITGGTLSGSNRDLLSLDTSNTSGPRITLYENGNLIALIGCVPKQTTTDYGAYFVNVSSKFGVILGNDKKAYITLNTDTMSKDYQILHSGNYSDLLAGGSINGDLAVKGDIILAPADTSDVSILFRSGTLNDSAYDYKIGKFTDANGKKAFGMAMTKSNGSWVKFLGISTDGEYNVSKIDLLTNVEVNGTLKTTGTLTAPAITTNTLKVGNVTLVEENGTLKVIGGFIATGGVTSGEKVN